MVVEACEIAATKDRNAVLLNESTDFVACQVQFDKTLKASQGGGDKEYLSMPN